VNRNETVALDDARPLMEATSPDYGCGRSAIGVETNANAVVGNSDALKAVLHRVDQVAPTDATVLLLGETGTGKSQLASVIHRRSARRHRPFLIVNCAALPASLIESELFGHEKGAFTGATAARLGRFELADGGTLLLDEIGDLPLELQPKLLRVLQHGELERLGSSRTTTVDVRVIAATNRDLSEAMKANAFRPDLYYRLNVFPIWLPALRQRREDISLLARHLVARLGEKLGRRIEMIPPEVTQALHAYDWPGNVRELENVLERAIITSSGVTLNLAETLAVGRERPCACARARPLRDVEREHILRVLELAEGTIEGSRGAAAILGLKASTLRSRMRKLGIPRRRCHGMS
jgi:transcriptional regulator with GAF, ATPase, and Fis domain